MPQISLYIDEETLQKLKAAASREHISVSKWVASRIKVEVDPEYPAGYDGLFGSIDDDTFSVPKEVSYSRDSFRESL